MRILLAETGALRTGSLPLEFTPVETLPRASRILFPVQQAQTEAAWSLPISSSGGRGYWQRPGSFSNWKWLAFQKIILWLAFQKMWPCAVRGSWVLT